MNKKERAEWLLGEDEYGKKLLRDLSKKELLFYWRQSVLDSAELEEFILKEAGKVIGLGGGEDYFLPIEDIIEKLVKEIIELRKKK